MAKILFIVNEHPNEAFAMSVAREAAKLLRAKGHEIIWNKMEFKETMLGKILKNPKMGISGVERLVMHDSKERRERTRKLIKENNPDFTYRFHCAPHYSTIFWNRDEPTGVSNTDFEMTLDKKISKTPSILVEVKAYYKKLPRRLRFYGCAGLPRTTSQRLNRSRGLTPEEGGKAIAKRIEGHIKNIQERPLNERGVIRRIFPKERRRQIKIKRPRP